MIRFSVPVLCFLGVAFLPRPAAATASAELYTSAAYRYGRFEARVRFAAGDGVVSSFFLWKDGSEKSGTFWNELDYEKLNADCHVQTNTLYGNPVGDHGQKASLGADLCSAFHVYSYEWLPDSITFFVDGTRVRQETGDTARAYADNAPNGMQLHFNIWPGDSSFGGNFNPSILPVHQYIDWVQFSSYENGAFKLAWRQDFDGSTVPSGWLTGNWASPKNLSTHDTRNVNFISGYAVLSLTADNATGPAGAMPGDNGAMGGNGGATGAGGSGGTTTAGGSTATGGHANGGSTASGGSTAAGGATASGGSAPSGGSTAMGGSSGTGGSIGAGGRGNGGTAGASAAAGGSSAGSSTANSGGLGGSQGGGAQAGGNAPTGGSAAHGGTNSGGSASPANGGGGASTGSGQGCSCELLGTTSNSNPSATLVTLLGIVIGARRRRSSAKLSARSSRG